MHVSIPAERTGHVQCQAADKETQVKTFAGRVTDLTVIGDSLDGLV